MDEEGTSGSISFDMPPVNGPTVSFCFLLSPSTKGLLKMAVFLVRRKKANPGQSAFLIAALCHDWKWKMLFH